MFRCMLSWVFCVDCDSSTLRLIQEVEKRDAWYELRKGLAQDIVRRSTPKDPTKEKMAKAKKEQEKKDKLAKAAGIV